MNHTELFPFTIKKVNIPVMSTFRLYPFYKYKDTIYTIPTIFPAQ